MSLVHNFSHNPWKATHILAIVNIIIKQGLTAGIVAIASQYCFPNGNLALPLRSMIAHLHLKQYAYAYLNISVFALAPSRLTIMTESIVDFPMVLKWSLSR